MSTAVDKSITTSAWGELEAHVREIRSKHLRELFAEDPKRSEAFALDAVGISTIRKTGSRANR